MYSNVLVSILAAIAIGHSYGCLAFLAHDISHGSVIRNKTLRHLTEFALWLPVLVPPTLWRVLHNQTHHSHANTPADCDRVFIRTDDDLPSKIAYLRWFSPLKGSFGIFNPLVYVHFATYVGRNIAIAIGGVRPHFVATVPYFSSRHRVQIGLELLATVSIHWYALSFVWHGPATAIRYEAIPIATASTLLMLFIFTNHLGKPILTSPNTVDTTNSVRLPRAMSWLYSYFNFHVEHHLFPAAPSSSYPQISYVVRNAAPDAYSYIGLQDAWREILNSPIVRPDEEPLA